MDNKELVEHIKAVYAELKDFQRDSVENVFEKLYKEGKKRFLIADEVGLGKTIVAKGLIAKAMEHHLKSSRKKKLFRVIYICSNQALTGQNLKKLNIFKKKEFLETDRGRLIFQAFKPSYSDVFQLSSLTPSTSFRLIRGTGIAEERKLIYTILANYSVFTKGKRNNGLKLALLGNVDYKYIDWWKTNLDDYYNENIRKLRQGITSNYKAKISSTEINVDEWYYKPIATELGFSGLVSIQNILIAYSDILYLGNIKNYQGQKRLLGKLRQILTDICLEFIEADLYILDEFQRFKDLIATSSTHISDASEIAKRVFETPKAKVLLLSATPFKPFTTSAEAAFDEDHHKEFKDVLSFLFNHEKDKLDVYEKNRKMFFELLRQPENILENLGDEKKNLENLYREVLSRTERLLVSDDKNTLLKNTSTKVELKKEDIFNFIETDKIIQSLYSVLKKGNQSLIDFSKSAPYPLSFMDQYKVKEDLKKISRTNKDIKKSIEKNATAWIDLDRIRNYKPLGDVPNGNMRELMKQTFSDGMWKQLWISPCLPYYPLEGSFKNSENNSKVLVFSKWRMVPRAIASIVSYEAERLTIGNPKIKVEGVKQYVPDFYPNQKKKRQPRKPTKILALRVQDNVPKTMGVFSLLYPSFTLAAKYSLQENVTSEAHKSLGEIKEEIKMKLNALIEKANLSQHSFVPHKTKNWYWAAPLLLDRYFFYMFYDDWFKNEKYKNSSMLSSKGSKINLEGENEDGGFDNKIAMSHFNELKNGYLDPKSIRLGEFPDDLLDVLALQVIGSPAVTALRVLTETYTNEGADSLFNGAIDIASQFHSLFDKPESIAIIKLASIEKGRKSVDNIYWREVLDYCADGNLQSVLDEFAHLSSIEYSSIAEFAQRIGNAVNIRTSNLHVDDADSFLRRNESVLMRCHYAVEFGNQSMDKQEGINRVKSILDNFNSPFRPFVLASTSVGQEGLDFHYYCRKIMHWNLPTNPIDIEQREGRINRYKGLVIRQNLIKKYSKYLINCDKNIWDYLFEIAGLKEGKEVNKCQLVPYWHLEPDGIHIERIIPMIPFSREFSKYESLMATLTLYRLTFGQPRQEELVKTLMNNFGDNVIEEIRSKLMINLSPISYK